MYKKNLYSKRKSGSMPQLVIAENENVQSKFIVQKILELREEGLDLNDIAVLFRSSYLSADLEMELAIAKIPFVKFGGLKFIETAHVKDMIAYLRVTENPKDIVSWNRILLLIDRVGPRTAENIINAILYHQKDNFWQNYLDYPEQIKELLEMLKEVTLGTKTPAQKIDLIQSYYYPIFKNQYDDWHQREKDFEMLYSIASRYDDVQGFLTDLALEPPNESVSDVEFPGKETEYLTLSTIHSAKGLEWKAVFIIYAIDGKFPVSRAEGNSEELEEERRLMYVACTRAKDHLFITYPINIYDRWSGSVLSKPSRFLDCIDENLLEKWIVQN